MRLAPAGSRLSAGAAVAAVILLACASAPAAAYTCTLSPKGDAVIVKTDNPSAETKTCTVSCRFAVGQGSETISCTQQIPPGTKAWYVCLRPTNGKPFGRLESGTESCS